MNKIIEMALSTGIYRRLESLNEDRSYGNVKVGEYV